MSHCPQIAKLMKTSWGLVVAGMCLTVGFGICQTADAGGKDDSPEVLAIRRVYLPNKKLPKNIPQGKEAYRLISGKQWQALLKSALHTKQDKRKTSLLVEARYTARLERNHLIGGATWTVQNPSDGPNLLPLKGLGLPLSRVVLSKVGNTAPEENDKEAVLGLIPNKGPGLLLKHPGKHTFFLDWTLAGQ